MDHHCDHTALKEKDKYVQHGNNKSLRQTTKGWFLQVLWKDRTSSWEPLENLKASNPGEVAEYAIANNISNEAAFAWWVPFTVK